MSEFNIRHAISSDAKDIMRIYNREVESGTQTFDIEKKTLSGQIKWLEEHSGIYPAIVAEINNRTVAFGALSPYRNRAAYATTAENSVYVDEEFRGRKIGKAILSELLYLAKMRGFHAIIARVSSNNEISIRLHQSCGYQKIGYEKEVGRKHNKWLDVVVLEYLIESSD
jgi:L-amino acid N-acyltransferase YncA